MARSETCASSIQAIQRLSPPHLLRFEPNRPEQCSYGFALLAQTAVNLFWRCIAARLDAHGVKTVTNRLFVHSFKDRSANLGLNRGRHFGRNPKRKPNRFLELRVSEFPERRNIGKQRGTLRAANCIRMDFSRSWRVALRSRSRRMPIGYHRPSMHSSRRCLP